MSTGQALAEIVVTFVQRTTSRQGLPEKVACKETLKNVAQAVRATKGVK